MNYYNPNQQFFNPYSQQPQYGNNLNQFMAMPQMQQQQPQQVPTLNGKVVDSIEVVKATEVPIGGYGVFPKADLSEIYIKSWNNNGTTNISIYKIMNTSSTTPEVGFPQLVEKINALDNKIDNLISAAAPPSTLKKTEVKLNEY